MSLRFFAFVLTVFFASLVLSAPILRATDLTGGVVGLAGPLVGVGVALFEVKPNKTFRLVHQTVTAPDGKYHFNKVHPGQYVLRIGGINYPLEVRDTQMQDIPVIAPPRHRTKKPSSPSDAPDFNYRH
jgi:hypothetical protein